MKPSNASNHKPYQPPTFRRPTLDQATLFLVGHAYVGDQGAMQLLELIFPDPADFKGSGDGQDPHP
jgi:hypothetical protein